jgi:hypothetical protein
MLAQVRAHSSSGGSAESERRHDIGIGSRNHRGRGEVGAVQYMRVPYWGPRDRYSSLGENASSRKHIERMMNVRAGYQLPLTAPAMGGAFGRSTLANTKRPSLQSTFGRAGSVLERYS